MEPSELAALPDEQLLEIVQRQTFRYFWDGGHPVSGLAPDRCTTQANCTDDKAAIGGSGFGIMSILVAVERGWVTREAALDRLARMLELLINATCYHGAFAHFVNGRTAATIPFFRKDDGGDIVETSFLCMGLLCARQYFNRDSAAEQTLRGRINWLWEEVEWDWYTQGGRKVLYWHWSSNNGWAMDHEIHGWNECLITYVLAAASPRYAIAPNVYHRGFASGHEFRNGRKYYDIELPLGPPLGGPLFFTHYSFCGLDPRGLKDRYADYWELNSRHVAINRAHCVANPGKHRGYGPDCWGLTASDDPDGYSAHAPDNDNGTIAPTAALSSLPYAPREVMSTLRHLLSAHGTKLWGRYGFADAFCEARDWYADTYIAIDQGPIVIMMENFRTGLLWKLFMSVPEVRNGLRRLGFTSPHLEKGPVMSADPQGLQLWLDTQYQRAVPAMLRSVSPVDIQKARPGFGQVIQPVRGSIVASPELADWKPDPDYFFHWFRDSAVVIDAIRLLYEAGDMGAEALRHFEDFVHFSLSLQALDGRPLVTAAQWRKRVTADFLKFLRKDEELVQVHGDAVVAETRVNPDGSLDISSWTRPQHDGAPLRALAVIRWARKHRFESELRLLILRLISSDLAFTAQNWRTPSYDIWEEESGLHYYTLCVSAAALTEGAAWLEGVNQGSLARSYRTEAAVIRHVLDGYWLPEAGHYRSRVLASGTRSTKELDIAVILAAVHAMGEGPAHTVHDPRLQASLQKLEVLFDAAYTINHDRPAYSGVAMGRYAGDVYFSGGAYYFSTLGAAEFCFLAAAGSRTEAATWVRRGDAFLQTVRRFTPPDGALSEQFDQKTGAQTSARHLAWSYAAFISCVLARRAASSAGNPD